MDVGASDVFEGVLSLAGLAVVALLVGLDAERRGWSGIGWGLLCLCSCAIAIPVYFLLVTRADEQKEK